MKCHACNKANPPEAKVCWLCATELGSQSTDSLDQDSWNANFANQTNPFYGNSFKHEGQGQSFEEEAKEESHPFLRCSNCQTVDYKWQGGALINDLSNVVGNTGEWIIKRNWPIDVTTTIRLNQEVDPNPHRARCLGPCQTITNHYEILLPPNHPVTQTLVKGNSGAGTFDEVAFQKAKIDFEEEFKPIQKGFAGCVLLPIAVLMLAGLKIYPLFAAAGLLFMGIYFYRSPKKKNFYR